MRRIILILATGGALLTLSVVSVFVGVIDLRPAALLEDPEAWSLMFISRLPRTAAVLLTGASMGVGGVIMQILARNRFIEPTTAGTGQSAALGVLMMVLVFPGASIGRQMIGASLAAMAGSALFLVMIRRLPPSQPLLVPLIGLIYGGILGAGVIFLGYQMDLLQYVGIWLNGEFSGVLRGRYELLWISGGLTLVAYLIADQLTIAGLGEEASVSLGLNYKTVVGLGLAIVSVITALNVVTVGMIPFVGLVVPNIVARLAGDNLRATLPLVAVTGAGLVLVCDLIGRLARYPYEIPVGTVFGVLGSAIFLWLLHVPHRAR